MFKGGICFITDRTVSSLSVEDQVKITLDGGVQFIQYREKEHSRRETFFIAERLRKITDGYDCTYIVNDHADIALAVGADGVHLGQDDLPLEYAKKIMRDKMIGISTHSLVEAMKAAEGGASYIGFGPMYHTTTKDAGEPKGPRMLKEIRKNVEVPIVAIGGIGFDNLKDVFETGADAVAVASAILQAGDVSQAVKTFVESVQMLEQKS
jgi:thiamine-phosphate pyrophosphorylase